MTKETRFNYGLLWKQGKVKGDFEKYYLEFKDEIDKKISGEVISSTENKKKRF